MNLHVVKDMGTKDRQAYQELSQRVGSLLVSEPHTVTSLLSAIIGFAGHDALERIALIAQESETTDYDEIIAACRQGPLELPPTSIG